MLEISIIQHVKNPLEVHLNLPIGMTKIEYKSKRERE